jgi:hypothetical protein
VRILRQKNTILQTQIGLEVGRLRARLPLHQREAPENAPPVSWISVRVGEPGIGGSAMRTKSETPPTEHRLAQSKLPVQKQAAGSQSSDPIGRGRD